MASWKRKLLNPVQDWLGVDIVRRGRAPVVVEKQYLRRLLSHFAVDCVFDVGANVGQYGEMLREIGYQGPIVSFEPIPAALASLRARAARDGRWYVEGVALDASVREAVFNITAHSEFSSLHAPSTADTSLFESQNRTTEVLRLQTSTLGPFIDSYRTKLGFGRPFLKLDTQGNDLNIVRGAVDTLPTFVGLQSELAIKKLYDDQPSYVEAISYYTSLGFELGAFVPNNAGHFPLLYETDCIMLNSAFLGGKS